MLQFGQKLEPLLTIVVTDHSWTPRGTMSLSSDPEMRHDFGKSPDVSDVDSESTNQHSLMTSVIATYTVTADNYSDLLR